MVCTGCRYAFVLDPRQYAGLNDWRVLSKVRRAREQGWTAFTPRQVVGLVARSRRGLARRYTRRGTARMVDMGIAAVTTLAHHYPDDFAGLVHTCALRGAPNVEDWPEPDLLDYGAERILVVDDPLLVDLLVANGVHTSGRAIVVSLSSYPPAIVEQARELVARRPDVPVFVLHSSSMTPAAAAAATRGLLGSGERRLIDLGLAADAARRIKVLRWARRLPSVPVDALPHGPLSSGLVAAMAGTSTLTEAARLSAVSDGDVRLAWFATQDDYG